MASQQPYLTSTEARRKLREEEFQERKERNNLEHQRMIELRGQQATLRSSISYEGGDVIAFTWQDTGGPFWGQMEAFRDVLVQKYKFLDSGHHLIPWQDSEQFLLATVKDWLKKNANLNRLLVLAYSGHGGDSTGFLEIGARREDCPYVAWQPILELLQNVHNNVLVVADCCYAELALMSDMLVRKKGNNLELLAACRAGTTSLSGEYSFLRMLTEQLHGWLRMYPGWVFGAADLCHHIKLRVRRDKEKHDWLYITYPIHKAETAVGVDPATRIVLTRLRAEKQPQFMDPEKKYMHPGKLTWKKRAVESAYATVYIDGIKLRDPTKTTALPSYFMLPETSYPDLHPGWKHIPYLSDDEEDYSSSDDDSAPDYEDFDSVHEDDEPEEHGEKKAENKESNGWAISESENQHQGQE